MKTISCLFALLGVALIAAATPTSYRNLQAGDTLYVAARSGLNMRSAPKAGAPKLVSIPFSEYVILDEQDIEPIYLQVRESANFTVGGIWRKVTYKSYTGYVFGGYLTRFPHHRGDNGGLLRNLQKIHQEAFQYHDIREELPCKSVEYYEKSIVHAYNECGEGGVSASIIIYDATQAEGYFIMRDMFFEEGVHRIKRGEDDMHAEYYVEMIEPEAGCEANMRGIAGGGVVIEYYCGC